VKKKQEDYRIRFRRSTHVTPDLIQRLGLQAELDVCTDCQIDIFIYQNIT